MVYISPAELTALTITIAVGSLSIVLAIYFGLRSGSGTHRH